MRRPPTLLLLFHQQGPYFAGLSLLIEDWKSQENHLAGIGSLHQSVRRRDRFGLPCKPDQ